MKIYEKIARLLTGNAHKIPLLWVTLDLEKYHKSVEGSAMCNFHPMFAEDEKLRQMAFEMTDYIRTNYNMNNLL